MPGEGDFPRFLLHTPMTEHPSDIHFCPKCGTTLDVSSLGFYAEVQCPTCGEMSRAHCSLANFRIENILGIGGMSVVFSARDLVLGRELAVKVLNDSYRDNPERISRFESECSMMARVRHENVVSVYTAGWSRGQFYIAMEKVEGKNLELLLSEHKCLMQDEALDVIRQIAAGLQAAKNAGVLHRDMKPGNIIITPEGQAKVLDFGLSLDDRPDAVREEIIWATPFYVPPETLEGKPEDARTDIYALGMTLRSMITGVINYSETLDDLGALLRLKREMKPMGELYPHLDETLCDLIDHMTAFEPSNRPADYEELLDEIVEVQSGIGKASDELKKHRRNRRLTAMVSIGVILAGLGAAAGVAFMSSPPPVYETVSVKSRVAWGEKETLQRACEQLSDGDAESAEQLFHQLYEQGKDPAVRLASFLMYLLSSEAKAVLSAEDIAVFRSLIEEAASGGQHARRLADLCAELPAKFEARQVMPECVPAEMPAALRSAILMAAARSYISLGKATEATSCLDAAAEAMRSSSVTDIMAEEVRNQRQNLPRVMVQESRKHVRSLMISGKPVAALDLLCRMDTTRFTPLELAEHGVQQEYCRIAAEAFSMLQRHFPEQFQPEATPEQIKDLAKKLAKPYLADELYSLCWLLRGDYVRAFDTNPHKNNAESREPFAVLMRDWKQRLGM